MVYCSLQPGQSLGLYQQVIKTSKRKAIQTVSCQKGLYARLGEDVNYLRIKVFIKVVSLCKGL